MDNNFNNNGGADEEKTVLIQQDQFGNPQGMPMQPQFGQGVQGMPMQPQYGQGMPMQPQFGQGVQGMPMQPQYGQGMQGTPMQPQYGQNQQYGNVPQMSLGQGGNNVPPKKGKGGMIAIISICAVVIIGIIVALVLFLGGDDKDKDDKTTVEETTVEETTEEETTEEETTEEETTEEETTEEETTEETTEEAIEEATTEAPTTTVDTSAIPFTTTDWTSLEFAVDGVVYSWPMTYAEIKEKGFSVDSATEAETLEANYYSFSVNADYTNGDTVYLRFKNFTDTDKVVTDCDILGISFDRYYFSGSVVLCNGVTFDMTYDQVKAIMGEPSYEYVSDDGSYVSVDYEVTDDAYTNTISLVFTDGVLDQIEIENYD